MTLSRIVPSNSSTSWGTSATRRRSSAIGMSAIGTPPRATVPWVVSTSRSSSRENVVLPLPVRPTTPTDRPPAMSTSTSWRIGCSLVVGEPDGAARHAERPGRRRRRAAVDDRRLDAEQLDDAVHRPVGLLDHLELIGELLQRADHQVHVLEQQERGTQRDRPIADERRRQHERADESDGDIDLQRPPHPQERRLRARRWRSPRRCPRRSATSRDSRHRWRAGPRRP